MPIHQSVVKMDFNGVFFNMPERIQKAVRSYTANTFEDTTCSIIISFKIYTYIRVSIK